MRRILTIITTTVVGTLTLATLCFGGAAHAQTSEPTAVYKSFLPMVTGPTGSQSPAEQVIANEVLALVNNERANAGCGAVTLDARLSMAALGHSEDMALNNYFAHTSLSGTSPSQRVTAAGYSWRMTGENIAAGYMTAAEVMEGWMSSAGHRANILRCGYTQIGIGHYYEDGDTFPGPYGYSHYWTQVFATP